MNPRTHSKTLRIANPAFGGFYDVDGLSMAGKPFAVFPTDDGSRFDAEKGRSFVGPNFVNKVFKQHGQGLKHETCSTVKRHYTTRLMRPSEFASKLPSMDFKKVTGARIRAAREALGIDQAELAKRIDVEPSTVGNYEQGTRYPRPEQLRKLAAVLSAPVGYLCALEPDPRIEALQMMYSKSDKRGRDTIIRIAESESGEHSSNGNGNHNHKTGT